MLSRSILRWAFVVAAGASLAGTAGAAPSLVVVIAIDQFRGDYLERFREHYVADGFNRLRREGAVFTDCRYRHAVTKTACGHAVILTGVHANVHGIISNAWVDRATLKRGNCVEDDQVQILGLPDVRGGARLPGATVPLGASPRRLLASTVGDMLKISSQGRSKVIGISSKDRSAVLLAGKLGDAAYWMEKGGIVTSTYYMRELPAWVRRFNESGRVEAFFGKTWDRILPAAAYERLMGRDDAPGEGDSLGLGPTFPKVVNGGTARLGPAFYEAFEYSPFKGEVLADFAHQVIEEEDLGRRGVTDMLCLSLSVNDPIGHMYGPDSHEVMDITLRTDRQLAKLFQFLDARIGLDKCTIVLTADHGIPPLPERVKEMRADFDAGRVDLARVLKTCEAALDREFGAPGEGRRWLMTDDTSLLFLRGVLEEKKVSREAAENVVRAALLTIEFVEAAYTRTDLMRGSIDGVYADATLLSFHRERSGDIYYQTKPFWLVSDRKTGTNHGSPYSYDVHVPLVWFGAGVKPGVYSQRVGVDDIAPTLARMLGVVAPPMSRGQVLFDSR